MSRELGFKIEKLAQEHLISQGLKTITENFRSCYGEIDLIMQEKTSLVFVEVRYRKSAVYGHAVDTINKAKQRKLIKTANYFLQKNSRWCNAQARFDVVTLMGDGYKLDWIKDAF